MTRRRWLQAALAAALLAVSAPSRARAPVSGGDTVLFTGDSLTGAYFWYAVSGGLVDQINAQMVPYLLSSPSVPVAGSVAAKPVAGSVAAVQGPGSPIPRAPIAVLNTGVAGYRTADVLANVSTMITSQTAAKEVVLDIGTNDVSAQVPTATSQSNLQGILAAVRAWKPTIPVVMVSVLTFDETWSSPPLSWLAQPISGWTDTYNAMEQAVCAADAYCTFVDVRSPALTWESTNNTPAPGAASGKLLIDDRHPNDTGRLQMGNWTIGAFHVLP